MIFRIRNTTTYQYDRAVFLEPHMIRLLPRADGGQRLVNSELTIEPTPMLETRCLDVESNHVASAWFQNLHDHLTVRTDCTVETFRDNPFDYVLDSATAGLPIAYPEDLQRALALYRLREPESGQGEDDPVGAFAATVLAEAEGNTVNFLIGLTQRLFERTTVEVREDGNPYAARDTLATARGACRDLAVLFMDCARWAGLAARFVSGYHEGDPDVPDWHLHAWAEVYLTQAGWRGFDPTLGLTVADRHVAVAAGHHPLRAAPVTGTFRGDAQSTLHYQVDIDVTESA